MATGRQSIDSLQAGFVLLCRRSRAPFPRRCPPYTITAPRCHRPKNRRIPHQSFPEKKRKQPLSPFPTHLSRVAPPALLCPQLLRISPATSLRPVRHPRLTSLPRPSYKQKMRARNIAPRTRSPRLSNVLKKSVDFPLKKAHVGTPGLHALAAAARTYSLTARIHYYPFPFSFFTKEKKKENRSKFSRFKSIARFLTTFETSRWTRLAPRPRPLQNM